MKCFKGPFKSLRWGINLPRPSQPSGTAGGMTCKKRICPFWRQIPASQNTEKRVCLVLPETNDTRGRRAYKTRPWGRRVSGRRGNFVFIQTDKALSLGPTSSCAWQRCVSGQPDCRRGLLLGLGDRQNRSHQPPRRGAFGWGPVTIRSPEGH